MKGKGNLLPKVAINNAEVKIYTWVLRQQTKTLQDKDVWREANAQALNAVMDCINYIPQDAEYRADLQFEWKHILYLRACETAASVGINVVEG